MKTILWAVAIVVVIVVVFMNLESIAYIAGELAYRIHPSAETSQSAALPIPPTKLPSQKVVVGNVANGALQYSANCEACHGVGGKNGQVGPTLAGSGLTAGQVAFMVRNPAAVDKDSAMPKLDGISDKQLADLSAYVASLKEVTPTPSPSE